MPLFPSTQHSLFLPLLYFHLPSLPLSPHAPPSLTSTNTTPLPSFYDLHSLPTPAPLTRPHPFTPMVLKPKTPSESPLSFHLTLTPSPSPRSSSYTSEL